MERKAKHQAFLVRQSLQTTSITSPLYRVLQIYTYSRKRPSPPKCRVFDVSEVSVGEVLPLSMTGLNPIIQQKIFKQPRFAALLAGVVKRIEKEDLSRIGFCCNHGIHRSVAMAEVLRRNYYPESQIIHLELL